MKIENVIPEAPKPHYLSIEDIVSGLRARMAESIQLFDDSDYSSALGIMYGSVNHAIYMLEWYMKRNPPVIVPAHDGNYLRVVFSVPATHCDIEAVYVEDSDADEYQGQICERPSGEIAVQEFDIPLAPAGWLVDEYDMDQAAEIWGGRQ